MKKACVSILILSIVLVPSQAFAVGSAGFENASYTPKSLGQSNAVVARPQDGSTVYINPAGIVDLKGVQTNLELQGLHWKIYHRNNVTGDHNDNNSKLIPIPGFYLTANPGKVLNDRLAVGLAVNSPFGLSSSFPAEGVGHYTGYKNSLKTVATTMAGSVKLTDWMNVGAGATHYWIYDYGQRFNYPNANIVGFGSDGTAFTETTGTGWGWNLGLLLKPFKKHTIGVSYRSRANVKVDGRVVIDDLVLGLAQGYDTAPHFESGAHSDVTLPSNLTFGYAYTPSKKWSTEVDFGITGWQDFADQNFTFDRGNTVLNALGTIPRNYQTTFSFHWGGKYHATEKADLMAGFAFYEAAAPKKHVDNFLPDANRFLWSLGYSYNFTKNMSVDFAYIMMLFASRHISNPDVITKSGRSIDGRYTSILHGPMLAVNYKFGGSDEPAAKPVQKAAPRLYVPPAAAARPPVDKEKAMQRELDEIVK